MLFSPIALTDREWMEPIFKRSGQRGSEFTFANTFNWSKIYNTQAAQVGDRVLIRSQKDELAYLYPAGTGDLAPAMEALFQDAREMGEPLRMTIPASAIPELEALYPGRFAFTELRDIWDYLYEQEKLATLSGKKLHSKRNHINRFLADQTDWSYEPITKENLEECRQMSLRWCQEMDCDGDESLKEESCAVRRAFKYFEELPLVGGLLRVDGKVVAFTMGSPVSDDTMVVHIEKAFPEVQGSYPMINQQFVQNSCEGYTYINREDDVGDEGLRKAKLSYKPAAMVEKYYAVAETV